MREDVLLSFRHVQPHICRDWERRLRQKPVQSPLAKPDLLVHLMAWTLDSVWETLRTGRDRSLETSQLNWIEYCQCSANPLTNYFLCAKDVCLEILDREASAFPPLASGEKQACLLELIRALDQVAEREIKTFCAVCQRSSHPQHVIAAEPTSPPDHPLLQGEPAQKIASQH